MTIPTPLPSMMSGASLMVLTVIVSVVQDAVVKFLTGGFSVAPFEYSSIVRVAAIDHFVFGIAPAITTSIGSAIIILACLLLIERRARIVGS